MTKITLLLATILLSTTAAAQKRINLLICDTLGVSIERAIVHIKKPDGEKLPKELRRGLFSDSNGQVSLNVTSGDRITISASGFTPEVIYFATDSIKASYAVNLLPLNSPEVNVGYGSQRASHVTGSISQSDARNIQAVDMLNFLQQAAPGVSVERNGNSYSFRIRGKGTIYGDDSAMVLIDGLQGDVGMLNTQDIESVTVLKDAASTAIYGSRAAFGVILIKTKRANK